MYDIDGKLTKEGTWLNDKMISWTILNINQIMWTSSKNKLYFGYFLWMIDKSSFSNFVLSCEAFSDMSSFFILDLLTFESFLLINMSICSYDLSLLTSSKRVYFYWICSYFWWTSNILIYFSFKIFINSEFSFKSELKFYFNSFAYSSSN